MRKLIVILILIVILAVALFGFRFRNVITQEGSTISLVFAISELDLTSRKYVEFDETAYVTRFISENSGDTRYDIIKKVLSDLGWSYKTQEGSALFFKKDKETVVVETESFAKDYLLWDLPLEASEN